MRKFLSLLLVFSLILTAGCAAPGVVDDPQRETEQTKPTVTRTDEKMFTDRDQTEQYTQAESVRVELNGSTATASSNSVHIDGSTVTVTGEETYIFTGSLEGSIIVDAGEKAKPQLVLSGVKVSSDTAALEIRQADKVFVTLAEGSENVLSANCTGDAVDGAVFSKQDLTLNGTGSLTVTSPNGHGIVCKDDLVFTGGSYQIQSASHGLDVNDSIRITGDTTFTLDAGKDGLHCENSENTALGFVYIEKGNLKITAQGDGISAGSYAHILGGSFELLAGGGSVNGTKEHSDFFGGFMGGGRNPRPRAETQASTTEDSTSMKGLKAAGSITIDGGDFILDTADDGIHSNVAITVAGGSFRIKTGDDAFHADETLDVIAGEVNVETSYEGLEAHKVFVSGGELEIHSKDDGINAAGGQDASGTAGGRDGMFGGGAMGGGRPNGPMGGGSSDGEIRISGGRLKLYSSGDCLDANGSIMISDGDIYVTNPSSGDTSVLDSDTGAVITGGTFLGAGASTMMAHSFEEASSQGVIACTVGDQSAGTTVSVQDEAGKTLVSFEAEYSFVLIIISAPDLQKGGSYTLTVGDYSGPIQAT